MLRFISLTVLALGLSGCGVTPFEVSDSGDQPKPFPTTLGVSIPPSQAMGALPAGAGQVIAVVEKRRGNAIQHDITLAGAPPNFGENQINVTAFRYIDSNPDHPVEDTLPARRPSDAEIYEEMQERFPGGALPTSNAVPRNGMGAFGYAFGHRRGVSCLYAWQWIEPAQPRNFNPINNKSTPAPIGVRVRLCRPGMTEEAMVDLVRQMYVTPRTDDMYRGYPSGGAGRPVAGYRPMAGSLAAGSMGAGSMGGGLGSLSARRAPAGYGAPTAYGAYATGYGADEEYGSGYNKSYNYPKYGAVATAGQTQAYAEPAPRRKVRRVVKRRRAPTSAFVYSAPAATQQSVTGGYAAVPMPQ